jgi:hypothetical protein
VTASTEKRTHGDTARGFPPMLELVVAPAGAGKFAARLDGLELCACPRPDSPSSGEV